MNERVGTAQRGTVLDLLSRALEEGYLELAEYEERMVSVQAARTVADLTRPLADLPAQFRWYPHPPAGAATAPLVRPSVGRPGQAGQLGQAGTERGEERDTWVAALILGIVSLPLSLCLGAGVLPGTVAILLGRPRRGRSHQVRATIGMVLGVVGVALSSVMIVSAFVID
ncbi:DUF1707 SHOCT-like domain-containing protein [Plantactinospora sp. CA-294935]|uniref:DUF1707 SHOCT-like domain-containing protein n=1 Tax=Plantactinospora sp. CA-294935 TaxID=3240012 RepID=UPI003D903D92